MLYRLDDMTPRLEGKDHYIAPTADVIGDVTLGPETGVWFGAVLRGDVEPIRVGEGTNVQDGSVLHTDKDFPLTVGRDVTIAHGVVLHGCDVGNECLIGMNATVLTGARIGSNCLIGAHALVPQGMEIPDGSLVLGAPAKVVKPLSDGMRERIRWNAAHYRDQARRYRTGGLTPLA